MRIVCTGYLHFALGIELAGVGGYKGTMVLYFFGSGIATVSDLFSKGHSRQCVLCGAFKGQPGRPSLQRTLNISSSEYQERPSLPTVRVYYISYIINDVSRDNLCCDWLRSRDKEAF
jgi:hypothetical protein